MKQGVTVRKRGDGGKGFEPKRKKDRNDKPEPKPKGGGWNAFKRQVEKS